MLVCWSVGSTAVLRERGVEGVTASLDAAPQFAVLVSFIIRIYSVHAPVAAAVANTESFNSRYRSRGLGGTRLVEGSVRQAVSVITISELDRSRRGWICVRSALDTTRAGFA